MARRFEYQVCNVQYGRVSFVNAEWRGSVPATGDDQDAALQSCPEVSEYLREAGYDGWELAAGVGQQSEQISYQILYLKRER
jgi:hypothetical protein